MSATERRRLTVFSRVKERAISVAQAGRLLELSERQARRLWKRYREKGDAGLIHGLRGRPGNAGHGVLKAKVLAAYLKKYRGFSAAHAAEFLGRMKLSVPRNTCWRWLKAAGLVERPRRIKQHRHRRERRSCVGQMLQMDGSTHAWFGPDHPAAVLFVMIDDAASQVFARFYATENTATAFDLFGRYVRRFGLPLSLYVDRDSIYKVNDPEALQRAREAGRREPLTQFSRAMGTLGVEMIFAHSPQAKGRVERVNQTFQDRLVKELALTGITTIAGANAYLEKTFLKSLNRLIGKTPAQGANVHIPVPRHIHLEDVLCVIDARSVGQDWCVTFERRHLQIQKQHQPLSLAGKQVDVLQGLDGTLKLMYHGRPLAFAELASRPMPLPAPRPVPPPHTTQRPHASHPWNQSYKGPARHAVASTPRPPGRKISRCDQACSTHSDSLRSPSFRSTGLTTPHSPPDTSIGTLTPDTSIGTSQSQPGPTPRPPSPIRYPACFDVTWCRSKPTVYPTCSPTHWSLAGVSRDCGRQWPLPTTATSCC